MPIAETVPTLEDAATGAETPESSVPAASNTGAEEPKIFDPVVQEFTQLYDELNTKLKELGFFEDRPEYTVSNSSRTELGIEKRALLTMSRERVDIVYSLPADKLAHLALQELPYIDRKVHCLQVLCFGSLGWPWETSMAFAQQTQHELPMRLIQDVSHDTRLICGVAISSLVWLRLV